MNRKSSSWISFPATLRSWARDFYLYGVRFSPWHKARESQTLPVLNGGIPAQLYTKIPCRIGSNYFRVTVEGDVLPCCTALHLSTGSLRFKSWSEIWYSDAQFAFRQRAENIHREHQHLKDPEWIFCQQCPHVPENINAHPEPVSLAGGKAKYPSLDRTPRLGLDL